MKLRLQCAILMIELVLILSLGGWERHWVRAEELALGSDRPRDMP